MSRAAIAAWKQGLALRGLLKCPKFAAGDLPGALHCDREAVLLLTPHLQRFPHNFACLMADICQDSLRRCAAAGVEPDSEVLAQVIEVLQRTQAAGEGGGEEE